MVKVEVSVPVQMYVTYHLEVDDPNNLDEIIAKLEEIDPSDWAHDPNFYEVFGSKFRECIQRITKEDVVVLRE